MFYKSALAATLLVVASPAAAQVTGGQIGLSYASPSDGDDRDFTEYFGGIEYAFGRNFAIAGNIKGFDFEDGGTNFVNATVHGIYHLNEETSFGVFFARDAVGTSDLTDSSDSGDLYGIEAGTEFGSFEGQAYIGDIEDDGTIFGASGKYNFASSLAAIGSFDLASFDDLDFTDVNIGIEYTITGGPAIYGTVGQRDVDADGAGSIDSTYFEIGASVSFGAERGTTFDSRSVFDAFPNIGF